MIDAGLVPKATYHPPFITCTVLEQMNKFIFQAYQ